MNKIEEARKLLKEYHQEHINVENEEMAEQILNIDFEKMQELYELAINKKCVNNIENIEPVKAINPAKLKEDEINKYRKLGEDAIKAGKFTIAKMAGGQGTRLGHNGPKGTFEIELNSKVKSLFEVIVDKLKEAYEKYNIYLNCYIMTSPQNHEETITFFKEKEYFDYPKQCIKFFKQDDLPLMDKNGKLILGKDGLIKQASDGNGGIFYSMAEKGILDELKKKKIEWIFIGSVDNLLAKYVDTLLLGLAIEKQVKIATRTVLKNNPQERVGVLCKKNGKVKVIEYTEIPEEMRLAVNENGEILYGESHIMCNLFNIEAIEKASTKELKYHVAEKKAEFIDKDGNLVKLEEPNCYKFEKFIFDSFCLFDEIAILRGKREENFAPIKNAEGVDSPKTAKKLYEDFMKKNT